MRDQADDATTDLVHPRLRQRVLKLVSEHGARPAPGATWLGNGKPYAVICRQGHPCSIHPGSIVAGNGPCRICSGNDTATAHATYLKRLAELGAKPAPDAQWRGTCKPSEIICARGHACRPWPSSILAGTGVCRHCKGRHGPLCLLTHPAGAVKVGVASSPMRVQQHLRRGYHLVAQWTGLSSEQALANRRW